jgi:hypothetical protein
MQTFHLDRIIAVLVMFPLALTAQVVQDSVPLKNWPAPLYWQPAPSESEAAAQNADAAASTVTVRPLAATPVGSLVFVAMTPCRVVDTRTSQNFPSPFGPPTLTAGTTLSYPLQLSTQCSIPATAQAYSFNVTLVPNPTGNSVGYLKIFPTAAPPNTPPNAVTIDDVQGSIINNAAVVPAGITNGSVSAIASGNTDLVLDINGYYAPSTGITLALGSASAPSLSFSGEPLTGIYSSGPGVLNFAAGPVDPLTISYSSGVSVTGPFTASGGVTFGDGTLQTTAAQTFYTISGTLSNLPTSASLVLNNSAAGNLTLSANGSFTFPTPFVAGAAYTVTVLTNPSGETCVVTNGSGTVGASNVTNIAVNCSANLYTIGGTLSGLTAGASLALQDNGANNLTITFNGAFTFATPLPSGATYTVTVLAQPTGETCVVTNGIGTVGASNVTNIAVSCTVNHYTIGGTISGLTASGLVLQDNGANNLAITANGTFTFSTPVPSGGTYAVTVLTNPSGETCVITNGSGIVGVSNVTNIAVNCSANHYTIGGTISGLTAGASLVLQDNGASNLTITANGTFTFATPLPSGGTYAVTVLTNPSGETCQVTNGSGIVGVSNVTNIAVSCTANP